MAREAVIVSAVRTPIGRFGGSLKDIPPTELAARCVAEVVRRAGIDPKLVSYVVFGNVIHTEPSDYYLARVASINGGLEVESAALTLNKLCGSGLQAIITAAQAIMLGDVDVAVAGGAESMSRSPYLATSLRWGARMNDTRMIDMMVAALSDPFDKCHMGVTAENIARKWNICREEQDNLAAESHRRAWKAISGGYFDEQIMSIELDPHDRSKLFVKDETVRPDSNLENLSRLKPVFNNDGTVTAGNSSTLNDAAAAVVLMERGVAQCHGLHPLARLAAYSYAGVDPQFMGIGPVPAVRRLFAKTGLTIHDIDVCEVNEAFAAQALAVCRELELPASRTNPNGSGISLGHPIGATGCILSVKALFELRRTGGRRALVTMCVGGGQGIAALFDRE